MSSAQDAVRRGAIDDALALLDQALELEDLPEARELLGALAYADDHLDVVCREWVEAIRGYRDRDRLRDAARVAIRLSEVHWTMLGNPAAGRGWTERARRLLEEVGPCVEWGYLELARIACERPDVDDLLASAERARRIAIEYGDPGLEVRALADGGLALVSQGRIAEGFRQLDEALVTLHEVRDEYITGTTLCALLSSCDRAGDLARAVELLQITHDLVLGPTGGRPKVLGTHCNLAYGGVLCAAGRLPEAESAIVDALGSGASAAHRVDAVSRLAEIRVYQGRVDEAADLLASYSGQVAAGGALALVHAARGDHALARAELRRTVAQLVGDVTRGAPLLALLVECELALDDLDAAADATRLLDAMAKTGEVAAITVLAEQARARVALAAGDAATAVAELDVARDRLARAGRPFLDVSVNLDLARAHAARDDGAAAIEAARAAHATAVTIGAHTLRDQAAAVLRDLGAQTPRTTTTRASLADLTSRELDVLDGIRRGETNPQIAARLYLSPKTVEHHVSRLLAKLGVANRAQAAAVATAASIADGGQAARLNVREE